MSSHLGANKLADLVYSVVAKAGFRRKGRVFTRKCTEEGLFQVIGVELGKGASAGLFRLNLGIFMPEIYKARTGKSVPAHISEFDCFVRIDLAGLLRERCWGWPTADSSELIIASIDKHLTSAGLPFLDSCSTRPQLLKKDWSQFPARGFALDEIGRAAILVRCGRKSEATGVLRRYAASLVHNQYGAQSYVFEVAQRLGLTLEPVH